MLKSASIKKRGVAFIIAFVMMLALFPATVFANNHRIFLRNEVGITEVNGLRADIRLIDQVTGEVIDMIDSTNPTRPFNVVAGSVYDVVVKFTGRATEAGVLTVNLPSMIYTGVAAPANRPLNLDDDLGDISLWGLGLKHSISQYIPKKPSLFPLDIAVQGFYQNINIADIVKGNSFAINAHASKNLLLMTVYGGIGYEHSNFTVEYEHNGNKQKLNMSAENTIRPTVGASVGFLGILRLHADYSFTKTPVFNFGVGVGISF